MSSLTDLLGSLVQNGMSSSSQSRVTHALEGGSGGSLSDLIGDLGKMMGGSQSGTGGLGGMLGEVLSGAGSRKTASSGGLGEMLGEVLSGVGSNKTASLGGLGALVGALLGGGGSAARGAIGGGTLAVLASLAYKALQNAGQQPAQPPRTLFEPQTSEEVQEIEEDATIIVKAMINAAKADGRIDKEEVDKIIGKLDDGGLSQAEKDFFMKEAGKPMDLEGVIASAGGRADMAAQIYAASLLAIEVDTTAEQQYMEDLASGFNLPPQSVAYMHSTLGVE